MCEIVAPSGDKKSAFAAINSGADAIYLGLKEFSARSGADNFDSDGLREIIDYAAFFGVKVYVALNTVIKEGETDAFFERAFDAWNAGADALILQDVFLGAALKKCNRDIVLHLSTQGGVCNEYGARLALENGFSRVILARETPVEDIEKICRLIEVEAFVQGALCTCFSGQCYMSSFAGGNSGNRGRCKQPCRKPYSIDREGFNFPAYRLSLSDLSLGKEIERYIKAGVSSFKIEGRMRRPEYVAAAVEYYKNILSGIDSGLSELKRTYNRGNYTRGLAFGQDKSLISDAVQGHIGEYIGTVKTVSGRFFCVSGEKFSSGDGFKILRGGREFCGAVYGGEGEGGFYLNGAGRLKNGDKVFVTTDSALKERLLARKRVKKVEIRAFFSEGSLPSVMIDEFVFTGTGPLISAKNRPLCGEDIAKCFKKTGNYPLEAEIKDASITGKPYLGMVALNEFRRQAYAAYAQSISPKRMAKVAACADRCVLSGAPPCKTAVICTDLNGVEADIGILKPEKYLGDLLSGIKNFPGEKFLYIPAFLTGREIDCIKRVGRDFDGLYCDGMFGAVLAREMGKPLFAGTGFNITNVRDVVKCGAKYYCISKELTLKEAGPLISSGAFYLSRGGVKVMDLVYCPFGRTCASCDRRKTYAMRDEGGRKFTLRRYETLCCRFEVYNCANILCESICGALSDYTLLPAKELSRIDTDEKIREKLGVCTRGHSVSGVS